jgi:glycosyltransferase involved in cell wall biosynthesis
MDIFPMQEAKKPLVTIGIPTYNRADGYLKECLASALNQTYKEVEVIVSDNCSNDRTSALLRGISNSRLRYIRHEKNIGPANNFNYCLKQARGAYFLLLHDDDLIDPDFVEICMKAAGGSTDYGIIRTGTRVIDSNGNVLNELRNSVVGLSTEDFFRGWFQEKTSWYLCSTLYNTERLRAIGGFQSKRQLVQDGTAIVKLASKYGRVDVEDVKASFRKHPGELTFAARIKDWCEDYLALLDLMCEVVGEKKDLIRMEGQRFLCRINYNRAGAVKSPLAKLRTYLIVCRKFNYSEPLARYLFSIYLRPRIMRAKNCINRLLKKITLLLPQGRRL